MSARSRMLPARGWNRPVRPAALVLVAIGLLVVWVGLVAWGIWYGYGHWESRVVLRQQPLSLRLPAGTQALADVHTPLDTRIRLQPVLRVPLRQTVEAEVNDSFVAQLDLAATLPVDVVVEIRHDLPVRTQLEARVDLGRFLPTLNVRLPVQFTVPVQLKVPVRADVPVRLDGVVSGQLAQRLSLPVDETLVVRPRIDHRLAGRMTHQTAFSLVGETAPLPLVIEEARLRLPFDLAFVRQRASGEQAGGVKVGQP